MDGWKECLLTECHGHGRRRRRNALFRSRRRRQIDTLDAHCRGKKERRKGKGASVVASLSSPSVPPSFAVNRAARRAGGPKEASRDCADGGLLNLASFGFFFKNIFYYRVRQRNDGLEIFRK